MGARVPGDSESPLRRLPPGRSIDRTISVRLMARRSLGVFDEPENDGREQWASAEKRRAERSAGFSLRRASCCLGNSLSLHDSSPVSGLSRPFVTRRQFHREVWAPGTHAVHHAPSEILEPLRNLGRFPPVPPGSVRHRILANQAFSPGGGRGETREEGCGTVLVFPAARKRVCRAVGSGAGPRNVGPAEE